MSDLQGPHEGVAECYGLGISLEDAMKVAQTRAGNLHTEILTTERKCTKCGARFWAHGASAGNISFSRSGAYFCAFCLNQISKAEIHEHLKEIGTTGSKQGIDLSGWCG